jgi:hypothetical protein
MLCSMNVSGEMQSAKSGKSLVLVAIVLAIFSLLILTTIHTSPLSAGAGSTVSNTTLKQRQTTIPDLAWSRPVLDLMTLVPLACGDLVLVEIQDPFSSFFFGRYFNLPPPTA